MDAAAEAKDKVLEHAGPAVVAGIVVAGVAIAHKVLQDRGEEG